MARRALAKKISRKQAMEYRRTTPNPIGVTTLAAVNGPGAYEERYEATRQLLGQPSSSRSRRSSAPARRKATPNKSTVTQRRKRMRKATMKSNRMSKPQYMRRLAGKGLTKAQREGLWKGYSKICTSKPKRKKRTATKRKTTRRKTTRRNVAATPNRRKSTAKRKTTKRKSTTKRQRRVYGKGKYRALRARVGASSRQTYAYQTPSGTIRKIPRHAYLGYASASEMRSVHRKDPKRADRDGDRWARAVKRREKASISAVEGRGSAGLFTPNRRRGRSSRTITFEEWEKEMKQNRRRRKKTTKKRTRRNVTQVAANRRRRKKTTKRKSGWTKAKRVAAGKKAARTRKRNAGKKTTRRKTTRRNAAGKTVANRRRRSTRRRATTKRRTSGRKTRRNAGYKMNRKRRSPSRRVRRRTLRNQAMSFGKSLMQVLKIGGVVVVGYVAHRALSRVVSDSLLSKVGAFQSGAGAAYRDVVAGALVAAVGVPVAAKLAPGDSKMIGAGMAASLLQNAIVTVLSQMGQENVAAYLGDYTNAEGSPQYSGVGAYYEFTPGQTFGEYYSAPGMSGFGQVPQLYQAAAGQYPGVANLSQQAAGFGQLTQAAAGMGGPQLTQAAAGAGEYIVSGASGIGEYEEVVPQFQRQVQTDEGISPDLSSAERALSIAEAAAGIGSTGLVPLQSTVYPTGQPEAIPDMPGGSRAGIFAGQNGAFGPAH